MKKDRLYNEAGRVIHEQNARDSIAKIMAKKPMRCIYAPRPLKGRKGMTKRSYLQPVNYGEPGYDDAPFEETIVFNDP